MFSALDNSFSTIQPLRLFSSLGDMKRHGAEDYKDFPKRQRGDGYADALANGKFELRLLVGSKAAGAIIGKGGENIKRIRTQFEASVSVPDSSAPERVLTIVSTVEHLIEIVKDMLPRLDEGAGDSSKSEVRTIVHQSHAGALIGRSGSKIKELRENTHANIKVFSHTCPSSTDRVVLISGEESAVCDALRAIIDHIKEIPVKGATKQYDSMNYDPSFVAEYGGFGMGGMSFARQGGPPMGRNGGAPPGGPHFGRGFDSLNIPPIGGAGPLGSAGNPFGGPSIGAPPIGGGFAFGSQQVTTSQVTIPSELGGTIIGRGGERINRIREESGAHIILEPPNGQEERIITISGTQTQIHAAQYLLQQCVRSSIAGRKFIGDSGR